MNVNKLNTKIMITPLWVIFFSVSNIWWEILPLLVTSATLSFLIVKMPIGIANIGSKNGKFHPNNASPPPIKG